MKIVLIANTSWYLYNFRSNLIAALLAQGHQVSCLAPFDGYSEKLETLGAEYSTWAISGRGKNVFKELVACTRLFSILKSIGPDWVLTFTVKCNLYTGLCSRLLSMKQIANISGLGEIFDKDGAATFLRNAFYKYCLARTDWVFFQNNDDMKLLAQDKGLVDRRRCSRIPGSGVDLKRFYCSFDEQGDKSKRRTFLIYGRLVPQKGFDLFLEAARRLQASQARRARFLVMGAVNEERKESQDLYAKITAFDQSGVIEYVPWQDDVLQVVHQADVVVLPTRYHEGVPRTLLEGMACGKPLIATNWKGARDAVAHGENGFLIKADDFEGLVECMERFICMDNDKIKKMGIKSRAMAEELFDEQTVLARYLEKIDGMET